MKYQKGNIIKNDLYTLKILDLDFNRGEYEVLVMSVNNTKRVTFYKFGNIVYINSIALDNYQRCYNIEKTIKLRKVI